MVDFFLRIFLSILLFAGLSVFLFIILRKLLSPKRINSLRLLIKSSNYKGAIKLAREIIAKESNNVEAHFYLAESYYNEGKFELALIEYKATDKLGVYDKHISEYDLRSKLAELYAKFDNIEESLKEYALLHQKNPSDFKVCFNIGELFERKNMREQALVYYNRAYKLNKNYVPLLLNLGILLYETKKNKDALNYLEDVIRLESANYKAHLYLALIYKAENNIKNAIKHLDVSVRDKDLKVRSLMEKGLILMSANKYEESVIELERALKNCENEKSNMILNLRYVLASCYEQLRNLTEAIFHWEKIYAVKPDFKNVSEKLASYQELRMDDKMKDFMTATNEEFIDICKNIIQSMGLVISELKVLSSEGMEFYTLEGDDRWRNTKKKPKLIHIYRRSAPIDESLIRKLHEVMREKEIIKGVIVTASTFSKQAQIFAQERPIELIDKSGLQNILQKTNFK
jgi:tetratricopeptide (TPR) repeat protein